MLPALRVQTSLQAKSCRHGCPNLKKQGGFLLALCVKNWSHKPSSANSGERKEGTSPQILNICTGWRWPVGCMPQIFNCCGEFSWEKAFAHQNKYGHCAAETHCRW